MFSPNGNDGLIVKKVLLGKEPVKIEADISIDVLVGK